MTKANQFSRLVAIAVVVAILAVSVVALWPEPKRVDQSGKAVCVVREAELRRDIRGAAGARLVPGDDRKGVG